jgi:hypothetical protein
MASNRKRDSLQDVKEKEDTTSSDSDENAR